MKKWWLIIVVGLQTAWVAATVATQEYNLRHGTLVMLETARVDPYHTLRGDYITLNYKISSIPGKMLGTNIQNDPQIGTKVYVRLEKRGQYYEVENASLVPLAPEKSHPVLKGEVKWRRLSPEQVWNSGTNQVLIDYGLELFYLPEGMGNFGGTLTVLVAIPESGNPVIRELYVDGKPFRRAFKEKPGTRYM